MAGRPLQAYTVSSFHTMARSLYCLAFMAAVCAASPLELLHVRRQDSAASVPTTSSVTAATAASGAADLGVTATLDNGLLLAAAETDESDGTTRVCTLSQVEAFTTTEYMTLPTETSALYTISITPTIACDCDDGWTAGVGTRVGSDGKSTLTCQFGDPTNIAVGTNLPTPNPGEPGMSCESEEE